MANCKKCVSEKVCKYNDGHNLYCKEDYECPHFVEVVRCKDCRGRNSGIVRPEGRCLCEHINRWVWDNDFCSWGERKDNNV